MGDVLTMNITADQKDQVMTIHSQESRIAELEHRLDVVGDILAGFQRGFGNVKFTNREEEEEE